MLVVRVTDIPAQRNFHLIQLRHASRHTTDQHVLHCLVLIFRLACSSVQDESKGLGQGHVVAHELVVLPRNRLVAALQFNKLFPACDEGILADEKYVSPKVSYTV